MSHAPRRQKGLVGKRGDQNGFKLPCPLLSPRAQGWLRHREVRPSLVLSDEYPSLIPIQVGFCYQYCFRDGARRSLFSPSGTIHWHQMLSAEAFA